MARSCVESWPELILQPPFRLLGLRRLMAAAVLMVYCLDHFAFLVLDKLHLGRDDAPLKLGLRSRENGELRLVGQLPEELRSVSADGQYCAGTVLILPDERLDLLGG